MPRKSTVQRLPKEVREAIGRLFEAGRTLDEIVAHLDGLGIDGVPSRSALGRHVKKLKEVGEKMRRSREVADALARRVGDRGEGQQLRLNVELLHTLVLDLMMGSDDGEPLAIDPKSAAFLSKTLKDLAQAAKTDADHVLKIEQEAARKAQTEAAARVENSAALRGLSAETVAAIKAEVLGVRAAPEPKG